MIILVDEPRVESPRKPIIEEPVKPLVPHTREQVIQLCDQAIKILFDQNTDFSNRSTIQCEIPNSYFIDNQQGISSNLLIVISNFFFYLNRSRE